MPIQYFQMDSSMKPETTQSSSFGNGFKACLFSVSAYSTVRLAKVHSSKVSAIFRLMQLLIIGYIIGLVTIFDHD